MNFLTGKHVDRRTLLRGVGTAIALPFLDAGEKLRRGAWRLGGLLVFMVAVFALFRPLVVLVIPLR